MAKVSRKTRNRLSLASFIAASVIILVAALRARHDTLVQLEATRSVNEAIQAALDSIDYGYAIIDRQGKVVEWNPALERLTGWKFDELRGKGLRAMMSDETWQKHWSAFQAAMSISDVEKHVSIVRCEIPSPSGEGEPMPVRVTVRIVETKTKPIKRFAIAHIDPAESIRVSEATN